jgi:hypothetical protein
MSEDGNGDGEGGFTPIYVPMADCVDLRGQIIESVRENRNTLYGVPGGDGGLMGTVRELCSEWSTFKGLVKFFLGSSFLLNLLTLLRLFDLI